MKIVLIKEIVLFKFLENQGYKFFIFSPEKMCSLFSQNFLVFYFIKMYTDKFWLIYFFIVQRSQIRKAIKIFLES